MKVGAIVSSVVCVLMFLVGDASAAPVQWPVAEGGNGHFYEYVDVFEATGRFAGWVNSRDAATASTFQGMSGHLATVTSDAERLFLYNQFRTDQEINVWLGGSQASGAPTPDAGWSWVTGEPWQYTAWAGATTFSGPEPNDFDTPQEDGQEQWLQLMLYHPTNTRAALWNDELTTSSGYIVEYEPVPEPSSACALLFLSLLLLRRRNP